MLTRSNCKSGQAAGRLYPQKQPDRLATLSRLQFDVSAAVGVGYSKKTLAHPDYHLIQSWWHPTNNLGKLPCDFTHKSTRYVWLRCPGCRHECGRHHEWKARVGGLTTNSVRNGGYIVCPSCSSQGGSFCECQSVANHPRLSKEWHPDNPPARDVARRSNKKFLWLCPKGHEPYLASCDSRCSANTGCYECGIEKGRVPYHPVISVGRPDLAKEWDTKRNAKSPDKQAGSAAAIQSMLPGRPKFRLVH
jgi:hypothetical protein